jgi:YHS domain-containing protein
MYLQDVVYYVFLAGLFFMMMRFGCGAHIMGRGHHHQTADPDHDTAIGTLSLPIGEAIDPVCGKNVLTSTARISAYRGGINYFCSQKCREAFEAAPSSYAKTVNAEAHEKEHHHGCC